ncbi:MULTISPECIES: acyltransferase [unclassified Campylobacter]|uniref:acyltransferase n=1 Tax=unclassified Campylobacter TaxID=2593542 RepID=UPI003D33E60A
MNTNSQIGASGGEIIIGDNCCIGPNCVLRSADHNIKNLQIPINKQGHIGGKIILENDVWIASNCVILKDVTLKKGTVVAAGAVVNKNFDAYSVLGGVPAKVIKKRE